MRKTKEIRVGKIFIGGDWPITVQTMTKTDSHDVRKTVEQVKELEKLSVDIVRISIPDLDCVKTIREVKKETSVPIVADIHFDYKIAIESIKAGVDKVRINPGNIGAKWKVREIAKVAKDYNVPIRVGANSGSLKKEYLSKYDGDFANALVESALDEIRILESVGFEDIVVALKSSDVLTTIRANQLISQKVDYPLHLGITEAGPSLFGTIKSSLGIGYLLLQGIGNTIRVSLSDEPEREVIVGRLILRSIGLEEGVEIVSCPTCSRTEIDVIEVAKLVFERTIHIKKKLKIAVMGCIVNGIGESENADIGIAGVRNGAVLFKDGKIIGTFSEEEALNELLKYIETISHPEVERPS